MKRFCQHCDELIVGNAYRVTSEDKGITLLDMVVCSPCATEAKKLRLHRSNLTLEPYTLWLKIKGVNIRRRHCPPRY